jgi:uncharacterized protein YkuJ
MGTTLPKHKGYNVVAVATIDEVFQAQKSFKGGKFTLNGIHCGRNFINWKLFEQNIKCVACGISGSYAAIESNGGTPHINLWAVTKDGKHVMMTKDHIKPKSKGGSDDFSNLQTMCRDCNVRKGNGDKPESIKTSNSGAAVTETKHYHFSSYFSLHMVKVDKKSSFANIFTLKIPKKNINFSFTFSGQKQGLVYEDDIV